MNINKLVRRLFIAATLATGMAFAAGPGSAVMQSDGVLTGSNGMTLYTSDKDSAGKSMCNGPCATNWPPLYAKDGDVATGDYTVISRDDGRKQWALKGKPLYFWSKDQKAGDKTGDGFNNAWHAATP